MIVHMIDHTSIDNVGNYDSCHGIYNNVIGCNHNYDCLHKMEPHYMNSYLSNFCDTESGPKWLWFMFVVAMSSYWLLHSFSCMSHVATCCLFMYSTILENTSLLWLLICFFALGWLRFLYKSWCDVYCVTKFHWYIIVEHINNDWISMS